MLNNFFEVELIKNVLVYDCPVFEGMSDFVRSVASASITAAELLLRNKVNEEY